MAQSHFSLSLLFAAAFGSKQKVGGELPPSYFTTCILLATKSHGK